MAPRKTAKRQRRTDEELLEDLVAELEELRSRTRRLGRFSPDRVHAHREKLELSAADYGELVGVSALTIYNWEKGKSKPQSAQLDAWLEVASMGKRKAWKELGYL